MLILLYFISPVKIFWCVKYYKAQPYNMEHTLCVCVLILNEKTLKKILNMDSTSVAVMYASCLKCLMLFFVVFSLGIRKCARNIKFNNIFIYFNL